MRRLPPAAEISWGEDGAPRAAQFGDVYFSRHGGLDEKRLVFQEGCGLPQRWRDCARFAIGELGFGAGLSACATWRAWAQARPPNATLHFVSFESHLPSRADAARALGDFPEIAAQASRLLDRWPVRAFGPQRLWFPQDGFALTIWIGPAQAALAQLRAAFDAWFLDGFAPARNADMWSPALLSRVATLSAPNARAATYSAAAAVRDALSQAGFAVEKKPGFGRKRDRLEAVFSGVAAAAPPPPSRPVIIGAGIAGLALARAFALRGITPIVLEAGAEIAGGASGNPVGLVTPRLDRGAGALADVFRAAYLFALDFYRRIPGAFQACGVQEHPISTRAEQGVADLLANPPLPEAMYAARNGAAWHAQAGTVRPKLIAAALAHHAEIRTRCAAARIERHGDLWRVKDREGAVLAEADAVLIANGPLMGAFEQTAWLPIEAARGQIEFGRAPTQLEHARTRGAYVAPFGEREIVFGATWDKVAPGEAVCADDESRRRNLAALAGLAPEIAVDEASLTSRASVRAAVPDRAPIAGAAPDAAAWAARKQPAPPLSGLYVLGGLGARGFTHAPFLAEAVVSDLLGEPALFSDAMRAAVDPARFLKRALKRQQL